MEIIPAIDLMGGEVVRLRKGDSKKQCSYSDWGTPLEIASSWADCGARTIHIIDLDGAKGQGNNLEIIQEIVNKVDCKFQIGGGLRSPTIATKVLRNNRCRAILGSMIIRNMHNAISLLREYGPESIVVALDYRQNRVCIDGWSTETETSVYEGISHLSEIGFKWFLLTAIDRDGTLQGPDIAKLTMMCSRKDLNIMAAGGVSSLKDITELSRIGVRGVVVGKALYERRFSLKEALDALEEQQ